MTLETSIQSSYSDHVQYTRVREDISLLLSKTTVVVTACQRN